MPCNYRLFPGDRIAIILHWGTVTAMESLGPVRDMATDPTFDPSFDFFVDFSPVDRFDIDFGRMLQHVERLRREGLPRAPGTRTALFAPGEVAFGLARMFEMLGDDRLTIRPGVFRDRAEAFAFLQREDRPEYRLSPPLP